MSRLKLIKAPHPVLRCGDYLLTHGYRFSLPDSVELSWARDGEHEGIQAVRVHLHPVGDALHASFVPLWSHHSGHSLTERQLEDFRALADASRTFYAGLKKPASTKRIKQ